MIWIAFELDLRLGAIDSLSVGQKFAVPHFDPILFTLPQPLLPDFHAIFSQFDESLLPSHFFTVEVVQSELEMLFVHDY
jgi:hypothetical protein